MRGLSRVYGGNDSIFLPATIIVGRLPLSILLLRSAHPAAISDSQSLTAKTKLAIFLLNQKTNAKTGSEGTKKGAKEESAESSPLLLRRCRPSSLDLFHASSVLSHHHAMSFRRRLKHKRPPAGWEKIEDTIEDFEVQMRDVVAEGHEGERRTALSWKVHRVHWEKNRFIFDLMYVRKVMPRELVSLSDCLFTGFRLLERERERER